MNNLDPDVAERPDELIVYGGAGKAARNWACFDAIVSELQALENDETLLVQSGKPVAVFRTHEHAPRVLIANSNLVGAWANWAVPLFSAVVGASQPVLAGAGFQAAPWAECLLRVTPVASVLPPILCSALVLWGLRGRAAA